MNPLLNDLNKIYDDTICDGFFITETNEPESTSVDIFTYKDSNRETIKYVKNDNGYRYHIILYKKNGDFVYGLDRYEATLGDPRIYIVPLIEEGFCGFVGKKSNISQNFVDRIYEEYESISLETLLDMTQKDVQELINQYGFLELKFTGLPNEARTAC